MQLTTCISEPVPTLILSATQPPNESCMTISAVALRAGWELEQLSPAIGGTVGLTLHQSANTLHGSCTDVAGSTTVTLSIGTLP